MKKGRKPPRGCTNLASLMYNGTVSSVADIQSLCSFHEVNVNSLNDIGWSPLMIACMKADSLLVTYLLERGANPNALSKTGKNTPMHFAAVGYDCCCLHGQGCDMFYHHHNEIESKPKINVLKSLIAHGATVKCNDDGLDPPCFAAFHKFQEIVDFFVNRGCRLKLSAEQKARACEIFGVVFALTNSYNCNSGDVTPHDYLCTAFSIRKGSGLTLPKGHEKSGIAAHFSLFSTSACTTEKDWKQIQSDTWAVKTQCFLVADRVLPVEKRDRYLFPRLLRHGHDCFLFDEGDKHRAEGTQIFEEAVLWEMKCKVKLGSVLQMILNVLFVILFVWPDIRPTDGLFEECCRLLEVCLQEFSELSEAHLHKFAKELAHEHLGSFLYHVPRFDFSMSKEMFELLLQIFGRMICMMRKRCGRNTPSVTHFILDRMDDILLDYNSKGSMKTNRVKHLISALVQYEDAAQISDKGNSMLHSLLDVVLYADPLFIRDTALILIRNGCDLNARNLYDMTVREVLDGKIWFDPESPDNKELMTLISPATEVLRLEELSARTILRHKIRHEGILPRQLSNMVRGELEPDSELFLTSPPSSYSMFYEDDDDDDWDDEDDGEDDWDDEDDDEGWDDEDDNEELLQ